MAQVPHALVKDLLSTGYFFEDLKSYSKSSEIDFTLYSRDFLVPYLARISESYISAGQPNRSKILDLAVKQLSGVEDDELAESIFGLKKIAALEIDSNEKAFSQIDSGDKPGLIRCRQKLESAQALAKLLVSTIRVFRLAEINPKREKSDGRRGHASDVLKEKPEASVMPATM